MPVENEPLVSVIIAFLNEQRFLEEAIKSVLDQDYKHWELLLVDDGSTDHSTGIALKYAANSKGNIIYCEHEGHINKGLSASRNLGINQAKGSLIAFLDADDVWLPGKLTNQVSIFRQNPQISMIAEASDYWYSWDNSAHKNVLIPVGAAPDKVYDPPRLMVELYPLGIGAAPCPSSLILKKEAIEMAGMFEESFIKEFSMYEDQAFLSKVYLQQKVYISSSCNNLYRQRPESIVQTVHTAGHYHRVRRYFLEWLKAYLSKKQINDEHLEKLLKNALLPYRRPLAYFFKYKAPDKILTFLKKSIRYIMGK
ncbi:MAG TPA: glycosyltransferase family 2 protein [Mucilaginibacter sp.]|jgi:glycosyltransferase involved in cell wall biosynthesis